jgi:hypothetical protein
VMAWPFSRRPPLVPDRIQPARPRPAVGAAARAALPARQPLAIEAPAPVHARIGVPAGSGGLAMARLTARWPADTGGSPVPDLLLRADVDGGTVPDLLLRADVDGGTVPDLLLRADVDGGTVPELLLPADRQQAPAVPVGDVVTTR